MFPIAFAFSTDSHEMQAIANGFEREQRQNLVSKLITIDIRNCNLTLIAAPPPIALNRHGTRLRDEKGYASGGHWNVGGIRLPTDPGIPSRFQLTHNLDDEGLSLDL